MSLLALEKLLLQVSQLDGDAAEVGVYIGGSAAVIASTLRHKNVHLFDTFKGIPFATEEDNVHGKGDFNMPLHITQMNLRYYENVVYHVGEFPLDTACDVENLKFCFVSIDVDIYKTTKDCLEFFYPRLVPRGILIITDDYGFRCCEGVTKAVNNFVEENKFELLREGVIAYIVKGD